MATGLLQKWTVLRDNAPFILSRDKLTCFHLFIREQSTVVIVVYLINLFYSVLQLPNRKNDAVGAAFLSGLMSGKHLNQ